MSEQSTETFRVLRQITFNKHPIARFTFCESSSAVSKHTNVVSLSSGSASIVSSANSSSRQMVNDAAGETLKVLSEYQLDPCISDSRSALYVGAIDGNL